jgi:hypothetical protein
MLDTALHVQDGCILSIKSPSSAFMTPTVESILACTETIEEATSTARAVYERGPPSQKMLWMNTKYRRNAAGASASGSPDATTAEASDGVNRGVTCSTQQGGGEEEIVHEDEFKICTASAGCVLFSDYRTPPSKRVLVGMIRSANRKAIEDGLSSRQRLSLGKLSRYLSMQLDRLYAKSPSSSSARNSRRFRPYDRLYHMGGESRNSTKSDDLAGSMDLCKCLTLNPRFEDLLVHR